MFGLDFGILNLGLNVLALALVSLGIWWIRGMPERARVSNEGKIIENTEAAIRFKEFRIEVHALRNELGAVRGELHIAQNQSARRGDKLNMLRFIIQMVLDELAAKEPENPVLAQAKKLLSRIEEEPHQLDNSDALSAVEDTRDAADAAVHAVRAAEAKDELGK